ELPVEVASLYREPESTAERVAPALEMLDVFRIFSSGPVETVALRGLSMEVARGEMVTVMGPSGSGKSTFLHLAAGLDVPSAGEQQRVAIAAAAAREAPLVLADEPTGELDAGNEQTVLDALRRLRDDHGATVVIVTHSPRLAGAADRVLELRDGKAA